MKINVSADLRRLTAQLRYIQLEQVPFAASMALNNVAADVANAITDQMETKLDNPTPFTLKAYQFKPNSFRGQRANKRNLTAVVIPAEIQKEYLKYQIEGGTRFPKQAKIFVPTNKAPKNQYGNVSRANRRRFIDSKGKYFTAGTKEGKTPGIYLRGEGRIEPMAFYVDEAKYRPILPVQKIAAGVVRSRFERRFREAMVRAMASAK
jgi:hypothetical protein